MADRYDQLAPRDLLITLRSLPRRLDGVTASERQEPNAWAKRDEPGSDGVSFTEAVVNLGLSMAALEAEVTKMVTHSEPIIWSAVMESDAPTQPEGPPLNVEGAEQMASSAAIAVADRLDHVGGDEWARSVPLTGGGSVSTLELGQQAARTAIEGLRAVERASNR